MNKRLLLISHHNSYRIAPYIKAAKNLSLEVSIASQGQHSLVTEVADGIHVDFEDIDGTLRKILNEHAHKPFAGVLGSDDQTVELAAMVAKALKLPHNSPQAAKYSQRKDLARAKLAQANCPVPMHCLLDFSLAIEEPIKEEQIKNLPKENMPWENMLWENIPWKNIPWPCVIKPLAMSASRGVIRADNKQQFLLACETLEPIIATSQDKFEQTHALIEAYIDGIEIAFEGYLHNGQLHTITIFDKPNPLVGPYFAETIYVSPTQLDKSIQQTLSNVLQKACAAYELSTGAIHAECRIDADNKVWILEIASRTIGGDCARMLDSEGFAIEELAISLAINEPIKVTVPKTARAVMMIPIKQKGLLKRVEGLLAARKVKHIDKVDIIIQQGHELIPLPEGNQYLGYIFASAQTSEMAVTAIRRAYEQLKFISTPIFDIN